MRLSELIDSRVLKIVNANGIPIITFSEVRRRMPADFGMYVAMHKSAGFYEPKNDFIGIKNDSHLTSEFLSVVILHEIIHSTGHPTRLCREVFEKSFARGIKPSEENYHTEEVTAQLGMFKLAMCLGLNRDTYEKELLRYLPNFPAANHDKADRHSDIAVEYILNLVNRIENPAA